MIQCTECFWQGEPNELLMNAEDEGKDLSETRFDTCPGCEAVGTFEDVEDDEDSI